MKQLAINKTELLQIVKGAIVAVSFSLVSILLFAFIIRFTGVSENAVMPINQIIKVASIFIGVKIALGIDKRKGALKGAIIGFIYTIIAYIVFSILASSFSLGISNLYDILFASIIGAICGIILVNLARN